MENQNNNADEKAPLTLNDRLAASTPPLQERGYVPTPPKTKPFSPSTSPQPSTPMGGGGDGDDNGLKGYRIAIIILTVILVALSGLYFGMHRQQQSDYNLLSIDRDSIQSNLTSIITEFDELQVSNEEMQISMEIERHRADSIITQLKRERSFNYSKLKQYEREVGTLRTIMRGYLQQIDSLNNLNQKLLSENVSYKKKISTVELRAEVAEERAKELDNRVREGARLRAQSISITILNDKGREVTRVKRAERLSINFTLAPNELATPGNKNIYVRITSPDGYVLTTDAIPTFMLNGESVTYSSSREVDFQNTALPVSIFFTGSGFTEGIYAVELYSEDYLIGKSDINLL